MKKLFLVGASDERKKLMKILNKLECVEISAAQRRDGLDYAVEDGFDGINEKLAELDYVFAVFKDYKSEAARLVKNGKIAYKPVKDGGLLKASPSLTFEEFCATPAMEENIFAEIKKMRGLSDELLELKNEEIKLRSLILQLAPYGGMTSAFSIYKDTKYASVFLGTVTASKAVKLTELDELGADYELFGGVGAVVAAAVVCLKDKFDETSAVLASADFAVCSFRDDRVAASRTEECKARLADVAARRAQLIEDLMGMESLKADVRRLYDWYTLEKRKLECEDLTAGSRTSYVLEAWVPATAEEALDKELEASPLTLAYYMRPPQEGEEPPTYCQNNAVVTPYESVTNMYSAPAYKEIDPNPFVAFFFFLFFGMMLSDAGYGLILTLGAGIILAVTKPPKGRSNLIKIMFMGGISTLIWGVIFGSYFGFSAKDFPFHMWYWFNPIENPMNMLFLSLGMGIFQMCFGLGIHLVAMFKEHRPLDGICGSFSWYFLLLGLAAAFGSGMLIKDNAALVSGLKTAGYVMLGLGLVLLLLSGALHKKGAKKVTGALGRLYDIVNFFSDLMSYTRIFGLGLATAVIGMVFNQIASVILGLFPGWAKIFGGLIAAIIMVIGHVFNMGINALGAYVHNSRLQFVEFFNKFYNGGGRLFRPLGCEMKYYYITNQEGSKK